MRLRACFVALILVGGCKKEQAAATAPTAKEKGSRADKPTAQAGAPIALAAVVDGKAVTWTRADLGRVKLVQISGDSGEGQRDGWSLRDVVATLVDAKARVLEISGEGGGKMTIDPATWKDAGKQPILRQNRRGILKFYWVDAQGRPLEGDGLRGVHELKIGH